MPPVAAAPPVAARGRRRRPVRSIGLRADAPRTPPQGPREGRLPPIGVRFTTSEVPRGTYPKASGAAANKSPLVSMRLSNRSDGRRSGFRSLPLESLTLRSLPSIAVRRPRRRRLELSSESLELCGSLWRGKWPIRRSRAVSSLQITYREGQSRPAGGARADANACVFQVGFYSNARNRLDASTTLARRLEA